MTLRVEIGDIVIGLNYPIKDERFQVLRYTPAHFNDGFYDMLNLLDGEIKQYYLHTAWFELDSVSWLPLPSRLERLMQQTELSPPTGES